MLRSGDLRKYFFYAIGEIFLVMVGILLALQVNNWNEGKKQAVHESLLLSEMVKNLSIDLVHFESHLKSMEQRLEKTKQLSYWLDQEELVYQDILHPYFGAVYGVENITLNTANYENLKSRGFDLIREENLRAQINQFFEKVMSTLYGYEKSENAVNEVIKPYYLQHFTDIEFREYAVPIDPVRLLKDNYYKNLVDYRIINLKSNQLHHHPWIIDEMGDLIQSIEDYLKSN